MQTPYKNVFPAVYSNANVISSEKLLEDITGSSLGFNQDM